MVCRACRKESAWADSASDGAGVEVCAWEGTCEAVDGGASANARYVGKCPVQNADLSDSRNAYGHELDDEQLSWRYLEPY
jgi:hypothetical protein